MVLASSNGSLKYRNFNEEFRQLKVHDSHGGDDRDAIQYPDRPGEPDCIYYLRTGLCGYGNSCRYNHPTHLEQGTQAAKVDLPERLGQPDCQYFLKKGVCRFGAICKYHHPRDRLDTLPAPLNTLGLPIRQDQKSCPFYMRNGTCKFGFACKFNHPQPGTLGTTLTLTTGSLAYECAAPYGPSHAIESHASYFPVILPPSSSALPLQQGWTTYMLNQGVANRHPSPGILGPSMIPNLNSNAQYTPVETANLPERPDQPECQHYMRTGGCKYGSTCKYHHPKERNSIYIGTLGPLGFPLRPGQPVCSFYGLHGTCRYGSACKFDHPFFGYYDYAIPAICYPDPAALFTPHRTSWASLEAASLKTMRSEFGNGAIPLKSNSPLSFLNSTQDHIN